MKELPIGIRFTFPREQLPQMLEILSQKPVADETATPEEAAEHKAVMEASAAGIYMVLNDEGDIVPGGNEAIDPSQN